MNKVGFAFIAAFAVAGVAVAQDRNVQSSIEARVERLERDQTTGPVISYADRFAREVGRTVHEVLGLD